MISAPFSSSTTSSNNRKRQSSVEGETSSLQPPTYLHRRKSVTSNGASSLIVEKNEFTQLSPEALQATVNIDQASFKGKRKATANSELAEKRLRSVTPPQSVRMQKHEVLPLLRHAVTFAKRNHWPIAVVAEKSAWTNLLDIGMFHLCKENVSKGLVSTAATATSWCYHEVWKHLSEDLVEDLWTQVKETPPILKEPESDDEITIVSCTPAPTQTSPPITSFQAGALPLYPDCLTSQVCSMVSDLPAIAMTITTGWHRVVLSRLLRGSSAHQSHVSSQHHTPTPDSVIRESLRSFLCAGYEDGRRGSPSAVLPQHMSGQFNAQHWIPSVPSLAAQPRSL
ncbi:hypothetical protein MPER_06589 [Moniliophthora perniciosa FA553]|nr:hypothetical protein MPER_06589 [Moniliophthora perniciosa FA553]